MEIKGNDYTIAYNPETATLNCTGILRLRNIDGYTQFAELLDKIAEEKPPIITVNLRELRFLNSSGINVIFTFVIKVRNLETSELIILASKQIPWHNKSLRNLQRLMPSLKLEYE